MPQEPGTLFVVATPIGNLADLSPRARDVLSTVDTVLCEDTRHTGRLLSHLGITARRLSLHEHNEAERVAEVVAGLEAGRHYALVSDAGTPLVSDPGFRVVRAARDAGLTVSPVPGACAAVAALSVAGLPTDRFCFEGFLPARSGPRRDRLERLAGEPRTLVLYEAGRRIADTLNEAAELLGPARRATLARELTKRFETLYHGDLAGLAARAAEDPDIARGELVLVVEGAAGEPAGSEAELRRVVGVLAAELPPKVAARLAARLTGARPKSAYNALLEAARDDGDAP